MAITLPTHFLAELKKYVNRQNVIVEIALDSGVRKFGYATGRCAPQNVDYLYDGTYYNDGAMTYSGIGDVNGVDGFTDVIPCLKSVSSAQNKIDPKGFSTRGEISIVLTGRDNFKSISTNEYLKNRRVTIKQGFVSSGFAYSDYAQIFTGRIRDWSRKGDDLTITVADDLLAAAFKKKLPKEASTAAGVPLNYIVYSAANPMDIMKDILTTKFVSSITRSGTTATATCAAHGYVNGDRVLISGANETQYNGTFVISNVVANTFDYTVSGSPATPATGTISLGNPNLLGISGSYVDTTQFDSEKALWLAGWMFNRVLIEPKDVNEILNELQIESNSSIVHDGEKITVKVFAPPIPSQTVEEYTDNVNIIDGTFSIKSGYKDQFFNQVVILFDYDESNQDEYTNYQSVIIYSDAGSQAAAQWDETSAKVIKSKWIRSYSWTQPANTTGIKIFHVSTSNGPGAGTLVYTAATKSLTWQANGDSVGPAVKLDKAAKYQLFSANATKSIRVLLYDPALLPGGNQIDTIMLTDAPAVSYANYLGQKILSRFRDPAAIVSFSVDINNIAYNSTFIKPTDLKDITTDEAFEKGVSSWSKERVMITSVRPDFAANKVDIEAAEVKFYKQYGFIAPAGYPDYPSASVAQRKYAFIGSVEANMVNTSGPPPDKPGYYIW